MALTALPPVAVSCLNQSITLGSYNKTYQALDRAIKQIYFGYLLVTLRNKDVLGQLLHSKYNYCHIKCQFPLK